MKKILTILAAALVIGGSYVAYASQTSTNSSATPVRVINHSKGEKSSDYSYVKPIKAQSSMGTVESFKLYRDSDGNFYVMSNYGNGYVWLEPYSKNGWSHKFTDNTTWYCNVY